MQGGFETGWVHRSRNTIKPLHGLYLERLRWAQMGSGPTVRNDPVDHFREGPGCREASRPGGFTEAGIQ